MFKPRELEIAREIIETSDGSPTPLDILAAAVLREAERKFTDDQCFALNAEQHRGDRHPYTCGNDSRHRPLIATPTGWKCADCDYTQDWAHGVNDGDTTHAR